MTQTKCCPIFAFWVVVVREGGAQTTVEAPQLLEVSMVIPQVQLLDKLTRPLCATTDAGDVSWVCPVLEQGRLQVLILQLWVGSSEFAVDHAE